MKLPPRRAHVRDGARCVRTTGFGETRPREPIRRPDPTSCPTWPITSHSAAATFVVNVHGADLTPPSRACGRACSARRRGPPVYPDYVRTNGDRGRLAMSEYLQRAGSYVTVRALSTQWTRRVPTSSSCAASLRTWFRVDLAKAIPTTTRCTTCIRACAALRVLREWGDVASLAGANPRCSPGRTKARSRRTRRFPSCSSGRARIRPAPHHVLPARRLGGHPDTYYNPSVPGRDDRSSSRAPLSSPRRDKCSQRPRRPG